MRLRMSVNGCAAQAFQDPHLNLLGAKRCKAIESRAETLQRFSRKTNDKVDVQVGCGMLAQPAQISLGTRIVLSSTDQFLNIGVPRLNADFELQSAWGELREHVA